MQSTDFAPVLSATSSRDSVWIISFIPNLSRKPLRERFRAGHRGSLGPAVTLRPQPCSCWRAPQFRMGDGSLHKGNEPGLAIFQATATHLRKGEPAIMADGRSLSNG